MGSLEFRKAFQLGPGLLNVCSLTQQGPLETTPGSWPRLLRVVCVPLDMCFSSLVCTFGFSCSSISVEF